MEPDDDLVFDSDPLRPPPYSEQSPDNLIPQQHSPRSISRRRASAGLDSDYSVPKPIPQAISVPGAGPSRSRHSTSLSYPKPLPTPSRSAANIPHNLLRSAPASPPTPAPSPTPYQSIPGWGSASENEDAALREARNHFSGLNPLERQRYLAELLNLCDGPLLSFVHQFVSPRLKKDPFAYFPDELCLRV